MAPFCELFAFLAAMMAFVATGGLAQRRRDAEFQVRPILLLAASRRENGFDGGNP
jgi:hypothetical protein